jgi:DNA-binding transcriptional LysR family regulator
MDLSDLHIFRTVVREGGVTRAARRLHRVQSNVTTRVRQLEDDLGVALFDRRGRRLHLSAGGEILLGYADRLLDLAEQAREAVRDKTPRGTLRLGAMESTAAIRLPGPISAFHARFPEVTLELRTGNPGQLSRALLDHEIDAALIAEPAADAMFDSLAVYNEELVLIAAADEPPPDAGRTYTLLAFEQGCPHRQRLEDWLTARGQVPHRIIEMGSYHAMLGCVAAGMGVALMPKAVLGGYPGRDRISVHVLPKPYDRARTLLIWRKGAMPPKIEALAGVLQEAGQVD